MSIKVAPFGALPNGQAVHIISLIRGDAYVKVLDFGAHLHSVVVPDRHGKYQDVCLGFDELSNYIKHGNGSVGATVGRVANRIGGACFTLNGREYRLYANNNGNTLHGGKDGFDKKLWSFQTEEMQGADRVTLSYISRDGEEGFPGTLRTQVSYQFDDMGRLTIGYTAESDADTPVNLTNHAYFNLAGSGDALGHLIKMDADAVVETDSALIPTGRIVPVRGTLYDLRDIRCIGDLIARRHENAAMESAGGFDINYVLNGTGFRPCAWVREPVSGREMTVFTDQPGLQFYSGQGLNIMGKGGVKYGPYTGIALETQHYPDSVNQPTFPNTILKAGDVYRTKTVYQFGLYK